MKDSTLPFAATLLIAAMAPAAAQMSRPAATAVSRPTEADTRVIQIATGQGQVANQVERLVTHALIAITQFVFNRSILIEDQHILICGSFAQSFGHEPIGLFLQDEGSAGSQFAAERFRRD